MNPGKAKILKCPHCGETKEVMTLLSGNTFGGSMRSDSKAEFPYLPKVSPIQKCPKCGKYYFAYKCEAGMSSEYSFEKGWLNFEELKSAYDQFSKEGNFTEQEEQAVLFNLITAYNDSRMPMKEKTENYAHYDFSEFQGYVEIYIQKFGSKTSKLFLAELCREINRFEESLKMLDECLEHEKQIFTKMTAVKIYEGIKLRAEEKNNQPFLLQL